MKENWKPGTLIYPLPAVLVSCGATPDEYNLLTVAWTGTVCTNPPMCYISVRPERHSYDIIRRTGEFVINLTTEELARATDWCGVRSGRDHDKFRETAWAGGILCGTALFAASALQQIGIQYTTVGKAGFITALYIVLVPVCGLFVRKRVQPKVWLAVLIAVAGLYLLCMTDGSFSLQKGDLLVLACALGFTIHILVIDHFSPLVDGIKMSCIQFFTCSILSAVCMALFETVNVSNLLHAWIPILYVGILSSGVGYTLQIIGQKGLNPTMASLLMSLESVFSVLAGWIFLHQALSGRELSGCILMFAAIVLVQLPGFSKTNAVS